MVQATSFPNVVRKKFGFLLTEHACDVVEEQERSVRLEGPALCAEAWWDPRGEVVVKVFRRGKRDMAMWSYVGRVGSASVERLLELAAQRLRDEGQVLRANSEYFDNLALKQKAGGGLDRVLLAQGPATERPTPVAARRRDRQHPDVCRDRRGRVDGWMSEYWHSGRLSDPDRWCSWRGWPHRRNRVRADSRCTDATAR